MAPTPPPHSSAIGTTSQHHNEQDGSLPDNSRDTKSTWKEIWQGNKGMFLILIAEIVASSMDAIVRFLQQGGNSMHPFQVIVARMGVTFVLSSVYMWWTNVPNFPLGHPSVRGWLVLRALFGFGGLFCLYYSVHYLPLAEATVFRFLVPIVTAWACSVFLGQSFTSKELMAGTIAFLGVVIIAHPSSIFGSVDDHVHPSEAGPVDEVSPTQRLIAITVSVAGIFGASGAYTTIRIIGDRAHALISVNYFAILGTVGSTFALLVIPGIGFTMPQGAREWMLLLILGVMGFALQFLLTSGLQLDKSSRATSAMYTQVIFALMFDWAIWGVLPGLWSVFGGFIVIVSTLWAALQKTQPAAVTANPKSPIPDEETALLGAQAEGVEARGRAATIDTSTA